VASGYDPEDMAAAVRELVEHGLTEAKARSHEAASVLNAEANFEALRLLIGNTMKEAMTATCAE
jgi:hypothetical protein